MKIHVVYACDEYMLHDLAVSIKSLLDKFLAGTKRAEYRLAIHVIAVGFSENANEILRKTVQSGGHSCDLNIVPYALTNRYPHAVYRYIELVTIKYRLPTLLPTVDRAIWLDADTLVVADITDLWETDLEGHWIGTTNCVLTKGSLRIFNRSTGGNFQSPDQTVNAGVMLLDLRLMESMNVEQVLEDWTQEHQRTLGTPEQDAIAVNYPVRKILDPKWNWRGALRMAEPYWAAESAEAWQAYSNIQPAIVHLQAPLRPERVIVKNRYFAEWTRIHRLLALPCKQPAPLNFIAFAVMMARGSNRYFEARRRLKLTYILNLPLALPYLLPYRRYLKSPQEFDFPSISDECDQLPLPAEALP